MVSRVLYVLLLAVIASCACSRPSEKAFEMSFWAGPDAKGDPRVVEVHPHCCCSGDVAVGGVVRMPPAAGDRALEAELGVEVSMAGDLARRWSIPVDCTVAAVSGGVLIVPCGEARPGARAFAISDSGEIGMTTIPSRADFGKPTECPSLPVLQPSAYLRCFEFR